MNTTSNFKPYLKGGVRMTRTQRRHLRTIKPYAITIIIAIAITVLVVARLNSIPTTICPTDWTQAECNMFIQRTK